MSGLKRALGGLLAGYGAGIATQAKFDMESAQKQEENDALTRRALALKDVEVQATAAQHSWDADRKDVSTAREIALRAKAEIVTGEAKDTRALAADLEKERVKFGYRVKELGVTLSNNLKESAFKADQEIRVHDATNPADAIQSTKVAEDGQLYGVTKSGNIIELAKGVKFPKAAGLEALFAGMNGEGEEGGAAPAPSPKPTAAPTPGKAQGGDTYTQAEYDQGLAKYAAQRTRELQGSGAPVNSAAIKREWNDKLRSMGLRLTTGG
jgi:hypothetical protein